MLGTANQVSVDKENTTIIVEPSGEREKAIKARVQTIRTQMDQTESEYDKEKFSERLAKLVGGVAIIKVGAATEAEMKQTKGRVEDALHATRAAVAEGIVAGGGTRSSAVHSDRRSTGREAQGRRADRGRDRRPGAARSRSAPSPRTAAATARSSPTRCSTRGEKNPNIGYDANTDEYVDMFKAGIVDPLRVTRSALTNAASIAGPDADDRGHGHQDRRGRQEVPRDRGDCVIRSQETGIRSQGSEESQLASPLAPDFVILIPDSCLPTPGRKWLSAATTKSSA